MSKIKLTGFTDESGVSLDEQIAALKRNNMKYMEIRNVNGKGIVNHTLSEVKDIKERLDKEGMKVSGVGSPIGKIKITDDFYPHLKDFLHILDIAELLETKYIRIFSFYLPEGEIPVKYKDLVLERLRLLISFAKEKNIVLLHENEKGIYGEFSKECLILAKELYNENFKLISDPGNSVLSDEILYPKSLSELMPYIEYFHIKDAIQRTKQIVPAGYGDSKFKEILLEIKKCEKKEIFVSIEPHLVNFVGFDSCVENNGEDLKLELGKNPEKFDLAVDSFKRIMKEVGC